MKNKIIVIALSLVTFLIACEKDEIDLYSGENYIYFERESENILEYSFSFHPGVDVDTIPLVVKLIGNIADYDRKIELQIVDTGTTATDSDYSLPAEIVFRAGSNKDSIPLVLYNSEKLKETKLKLSFAINDAEELLCGPMDNKYAEIIFSDMISRPEWWDEVVVNSFLGTYSDTKYRLFIEATGIADMTNLSESEMRAYSMILRDFLKKGREEGKEFIDENGEPINVPEWLNI